jgi:hypothetical protein
MPEFDAKEWAMGHEKLCASRYESIDAKLQLITNVGGWAGALAAATILGALVWNVEENQHRSEQQIEAMRSTTATVISQVRASGSQPAPTPQSGN